MGQCNTSFEVNDGMCLAEGGANLKRELAYPPISAPNGVFYVGESQDVSYRSENTMFEENVYPRGVMHQPVELAPVYQHAGCSKGNRQRNPARSNLACGGFALHSEERNPACEGSPMKFGFLESSGRPDRLATGYEICCAISLAFPGASELVGLCDDFSKTDSHSSGRAYNLLEDIGWLMIVHEMRDSISN